MSGGLFVAILVLLGMMAVIFAAVVLLTRRLGSGAERRADELRDEVERLGEAWSIPLEGATYYGATHSGAGNEGATHTYSRVKGNGVLGLTGRRVVFAPISGERLSVPLVRVSGARLKGWRRSGAGGRRRHLVLELDDGGKVSFLVGDPAVWMRRLAEAGVEVLGFDAAADEHDGAPPREEVPPGG